MTRKHEIFGILIATLLIGGSYLLSSNAGIRPVPIGKSYTVVIQPSGFTPNQLTINQGDSVVFKSFIKESFWPASDPHPTHLFLVGFDPNHAIKNTDSWSYQFNKTGIWNYHDHLNISFTGTITVLDNNRSPATLSSYCKKTNPEDKLQCFDQKIRDAVRSGGVDYAFDIFSQIFESGQAPEGCHWTAHVIGQESYKYYKQGRKFKITQASSYCGYAFYHGFMESLLRDKGDVKEALDFCHQVGASLGGLGQDNCFHGIGHGFTEDPPDPKVWGNPQELVKPGLDVCEKLFGKIENKWEICATGVYTVLASFMSEEKYQFLLDHKDPFSFCRSQPDRYNRACYGEFAPKLGKLIGNDISKVGFLIKDISQVDLATYVVRTAVGPMLSQDISKADLTSYIYGCRTLDKELFQQECIKAVVWGLVAHGEPKKEYTKALSFCNSHVLTELEKRSCFQESSTQFKRTYPLDQVAQICQTQIEPYRSICLGSNE